MRCETCQDPATVHIEVIGMHFCQSCLEKIDKKIADMKYYRSEYCYCPNCFRPLEYGVSPPCMYVVKCSMIHCLYYNDPSVGESLPEAVQNFRLKVNPKDVVKA
jgi:hypothetical protein